MRREYHKSESYIDWLKSLGCVVYLPFSEDLDLKDRISGLDLQTTQNGSISWNSTENACEINAPTVNSAYTAILNNGLNKTWFPDNNYTTIISVKALKRQNGLYMRTHSPNSNISNTVAVFSAGYNGTGNTGSWPDSWFDYAMVTNHTLGNRTAYVDGSLDWTASEYSPYLPQNWNLKGDGFLLGPSDQYGNGKNTRYVVRNIYIFNTALDMQTIRKIQGYE